MAVELKPKFSKQDLENVFKDRLARIEQAVISRLQYVGEQFVELARTNNTYKDHTGNLRNSIGYIILKDGQQLFDNFKQTAIIQPEAKQKPEDGMEVGISVAGEVAQSYPKGLVLIVVAGMNYGVYVESKGFDVLTGSSMIAEGLLKDGLKELQSKIGQMK